MTLSPNWRAFGLGFASLRLIAPTACDDKSSDELKATTWTHKDDPRGESIR